jgi:hypothetical protein
MTPVPGPRAFPDRVPAWYIHTTDAVVLGGPFPVESAARTACTRFAAGLAASMRRDGGPSSPDDVRECVARLRVGYGLRPKPHGLFEAVPSVGSDD